MNYLGNDVMKSIEVWREWDTIGIESWEADFRLDVSTKEVLGGNYNAVHILLQVPIATS